MAQHLRSDSPVEEEAVAPQRPKRARRAVSRLEEAPERPRLPRPLAGTVAAPAVAEVRHCPLFTLLLLSCGAPLVLLLALATLLTRGLCRTRRWHHSLTQPTAALAARHPRHARHPLAPPLLYGMSATSIKCGGGRHALCVGGCRIGGPMTRVPWIGAPERRSVSEQLDRAEEITKIKKMRFFVAFSFAFGPDAQPDARSLALQR